MEATTDQLVDLIQQTGQALSFLPTLEEELRLVQAAVLHKDVRTAMESAQRARRMIRRLATDMDVADWLTPLPEDPART
jgi:16S rRNA G527 N7-methylase RsmG